MEKALKLATSYLEDFLSFFGLNVKVEGSIDEKTLELQVPSTQLNGFLIGYRGEGLRAIQHLTNMALRQAEFLDCVAVVDIAGYKKQRQDNLAAQVKAMAEEVLSSKESKTLEPMSAYERRVVHKTVGEIEGITSESIGEGRDRRVVIKPASVEL